MTPRPGIQWTDLFGSASCWANNRNGMWQKGENDKSLASSDDGLPKFSETRKCKNSSDTDLGLEQAPMAEEAVVKSQLYGRW